MDASVTSVYPLSIAELHLRVHIKMPAKKRPQIIMEVLTKSKPANLKQAMKPPMAETVQRVERHISYDVSGESSSSFIPVPPSPPRSFHPVQNPTTSPSVPSSSFFPPTEDDIERVDDETRLLEVEGLGSLSANLSTQVTPDNDDILPDSAHKRKRTDAVCSHLNKCTVY
jgi:hypothetical protein